MRILAGGPTRSIHSDIYKAHLECLERQVFEGCELTIRHKELPDEEGPKWTLDKMSRVGAVRQELFDAVTEMPEAPSPTLPDWSFDGLFMVDDDILLGPGVLQRMTEVEADVVYGVFLSDWPGLPRAVQVWDINPYGQTQELQEQLAEGMGVLSSDWGFEMLIPDASPREVEVYGGGACSLFRGDAFKSHYHPILSSLANRGAGDMWGGEDRTYCLGLETRGIRQVAVVGLPILHLDKPSMQTEEAIWEGKQMLGWMSG